MLIYENLYKWKEVQPSKSAVIYADVILSYRELYAKSSGIAHSLTALLKKGDKILLMKKNPLEQILWFLGASMAGVVPVFVAPETPDGIRQQITQLIEPKLTIDEDYPVNPHPLSPLPKIKKEDIFLGALTSGTTGLPKVIWRDHQSWSSAFSHQSKVFQIAANDKLYLVGSLAYSANLNSCLHMLYEGGSVYLAKSKNPKVWIQEIEAFDITTIFMVPSHYQLLLKPLKRPIPNMKSLLSAGAKISVDIIKNLLLYFPNAHIVEYYGSSELGHISYITAKELLMKPDSVGQPFPMVEFYLEEDEIWVNSPYIAPAYRSCPTVGDIGEIDEEGYLYLLGRKNNMINKGGTKIIPSHVEKILLGCQGIDELVVLGEKHPSKGQVIAAYIVNKDDGLTLDQVKSYCKSHLSPHERPQRVYFIEDIPKNNSGKVDRLTLLKHTSPEE